MLVRPTISLAARTRPAAGHAADAERTASAVASTLDADR